MPKYFFDVVAGEIIFRDNEGVSISDSVAVRDHARAILMECFTGLRKDHVSVIVRDETGPVAELTCSYSENPVPGQGSKPPRREAALRVVR